MFLRNVTRLSADDIYLSQMIHSDTGDFDLKCFPSVRNQRQCVSPLYCQSLEKKKIRGCLWSRLAISLYVYFC
jgi:hypothetical protein